MLVERAIAYLFVIPFASVAIGTAKHLGPAGTIVLDLALTLALEAVLLKTAAAVLVAIKSLPLAVPLAYLLPIVLPTPTVSATLFAATVAAAMAVGVGTFARRHRHARYDPHHWRRPGLALAALLVGVGLEMFAAGAALSVPPVTFVHLAAVAAGLPWWWAAYALQSPPGPARLRPAIRDLWGRVGLAAGAR